MSSQLRAQAKEEDKHMCSGPFKVDRLENFIFGEGKVYSEKSGREEGCSQLWNHEIYFIFLPCLLPSYSNLAKVELCAALAMK